MEKFKKIGIVGTGNHGRVVLDTLLAMGQNLKPVFLDMDKSKWGSLINECPVESGLENCNVDGVHIAIGNPLIRRKVAEQVKALGIPLFSVIHPTAVIMKSATVAPGTFIAAQSVINSNAKISSNVLINTGAIVEHDTIVAEFATICPRSCVGAICKVGEGAFIGSGAIIEARVELGEFSAVGMGSVVTKNVKSHSLSYGVPARPVRKVEGQAQWTQIFSGEKHGTV